VLFVAIGGIASTAGKEFLPLVLAGGAGAALGDLFTFSVGRIYRHRIRDVWPFREHQERIRRGHAFFERWGALSIIVGKFLGMLRPFLPLAAGTMDMPWALFVIASVVSSLIWAGVCIAPGYGIAALFN
jgi:membrane protein DedA with SNARE-associated domain